MPELADRRELLTSALADLLTEGAVPEHRGVPHHVAASWRRSVSQGVRPHAVECSYFAELDVDSRLARCAGPEIDRLVEQIADIPACVALTDDHARILSRVDSGFGFGRVADAVSFAQGFGYAEGSVGTNGVGTVLEFGESVHIVGAEHFVESLQPFACAGAPVRDPFTGRVAGVLDISCRTEHSHPVLHTLVRSAAARIERSLLADRDQLPRALFEAYSRVDARTRGAVLAIGPRLTMANTAMQTLLPDADHGCLHDHLRYLGSVRDRLDDRVDLPSGARVRVRGSRVRVGGEVAGVVAVIGVLSEVDAAPARPDPPARRLTGRGRLVEGTVPAWRTAAAAVECAVRAGEPVLVLGERGSGRTTVLTEVFARVHPGGRCVVVDAAEVAERPGTVAERVGDTSDTGGAPVLVVLRELDAVPPAAAQAVRDAVDAHAGAVPAATGTPSGQADHPLASSFGAAATVPPLRHRGADLPSLTAALLAELAPDRDVRLSPEAQRVLARHHWPGNVAELVGALADALRRCSGGVIEVADLPADCQSAGPGRALRRVDEAERDTIVTALREAGGNRKAAAAALGLARSTLYRKIRCYGITD